MSFDEKLHPRGQDGKFAAAARQSSAARQPSAGGARSAGGGVRYRRPEREQPGTGGQDIKQRIRQRLAEAWRQR